MRMSTTRIVAGAVAAAAVLATTAGIAAFALAGGGTAGEAGSAAGAPGAAEAIPVFGRWTLEVQNPDGTVAARRHFENALTLSGEVILADLLSGQRSPGLFAVALRDANGGGPCEQPDGSPVNCVSADPTSGLVTQLNEPYIFATLQTTTISSQSNGVYDVVELSGYVDVADAGTIGVVATPFSECPAAVATADCTSRSTRDFTRHTLSDPVSVIPNQRVAIQVRISFGSAS
jgi:hypothetical protein